MRAIVALAFVGLWSIAPASAQSPLTCRVRPPPVIGTYDTPYAAQDVALAGSHALVADLSSLLVIDLSRPARPRRVGTFRPRGEADCRAVAVHAGRALVACSSGVHVLDLSRPSRPRQIHHVPLAHPHTLAVDGDRAIVASTTRMLVLDLSAPTPRVAADLELARIAVIALEGERAYVLRLESALDVLEVGGPMPRLLGSLPVTSVGFGLDVEAGRVVLIDDGILRVVDARDPTAIRVLGTLRLPAFSLALSGDRLYAGTASDVAAIDLRDPTSPRIVGSFGTLDRAQGLHVDGTRLLVAAYQRGGLRVLDLADPTGAHRSEWAAVTRRQPIGLFSLDGEVVLSDPLGVRVLGPDLTHRSTLLSGTGNDVARIGEWVVRAGEGLSALGSDGQEIVLSRERSHILAPSRHGVWVAQAERGVALFAAPPAIQEIARIPTTGPALDVVVLEDLVLVADAGAGVRVLDARDPRAPRELGIVSMPGRARAIATGGARVFAVFDEDVGAPVPRTTLVAIDPARRTVLARYTWYGEVIGIEVAGDQLVVATETELSVFDVSRPDTIARTAALELLGHGGGIEGRTPRRRLLLRGDDAFVLHTDSVERYALCPATAP